LLSPRELDDDPEPRDDEPRDPSELESLPEFLSVNRVPTSEPVPENRDQVMGKRESSLLPELLDDESNGFFEIRSAAIDATRPARTIQV